MKLQPSSSTPLAGLLILGKVNEHKSEERSSERAMAADRSHSTQAQRALGRALLIVDAGPAPLYRVAMASLAGTCMLAISIALVIRPPGSMPRSQAALIISALAVACLVGVLRLASRLWSFGSRGRMLDRVIAPAERAAIWLALAVWFPILLIPVYFHARATERPSVQWISFGYLDKRWETSAYLLGILAPMLIVVAAARVLKVGRGHPQSWREWLRDMVSRADAAEIASPDASRAGRWITFARVAAGILTAVALAYYFYGPPWYLNRYTGSISYQEDVYLAGLQAISKGHLPYIGPASVPYGPGAQLFSYLYMRHIGTFSVLGFRESWALLQWAGATVFFVTLFLAFGYVRGLAAALLAALVYPTLQLMGFLPGQTYAGFFGWANPLRYAGAFTLIILLPVVVKRCPSRRGLAAGLGIGVLWGILSYVAQENLIAGVIGMLAIGALLLLSGTSSGRAVRSALFTVFAGFLLAWLPVLGYYMVKGVLARFVWLYLLLPRAVAEGYSNTPLRQGLHDPLARTFYVFPFVLAVLALLAVCEFRPFRIAVEWSRDKILLVATLVTTIVLYQGALLRSDVAHLSGTMLAVPALVVIVATKLPRLVGAHRRATLVVAGAALVAAAFALLPYRSFEWLGVQARLEAPYLDRQRLSAEPDPSMPATVAGKRVGTGVAAGRKCCQGSRRSMPEFIQLMDHIHAIVGDRVTYVVRARNGYPGLIYFVADLNPAPIPLDPYTMVLTQPQRLAFLDTFRSRVLPETQALVTSSLTAPETRYFLQRYEHTRRITLSYPGGPYYIILS